jgi:hypothetical protein
MTPTHSKSGSLTIVCILIFSILFVGGLYYYAHRNAASRPEYTSATPGIPPQKLVMISCNLHWSAPGAKLIMEFKSLRPDFILLQQVSLKDAESLAASLDMRHGGELQLYYSPTNPGTTEAPGNAIISRHAIFQGRVISDKFAGDAGIWVEPVILGKRFYLANVDLTPPPLAAPAAKLRQETVGSLIASFSEAPTPCIIAGAIPGSIKMPKGLSHDLLMGEPSIARFFLSSGWPPPRMGDGKVEGISYGMVVFQP